jgi:uncharacterized membrane protein YfcA
VGGAVTSIPFLVWCNVPVRVAIGTASAIGLPVAIAGSLGCIGHGLGAAELPPFAIGYVHLPAPLGARASHRLPVPLLKKVLAVVLYAVTLRSLLAWA